MKKLLTILAIVAVCSSGYGQTKRHTHSPVKGKEIPGNGRYDSILYEDSTTIKRNKITYVLRNYQCRICDKWYKVRTNIDTFSTVRKARYSNIKYRKN